jgi:hypothetical protein
MCWLHDTVLLHCLNTCLLFLGEARNQAQIFAPLALSTVILINIGLNNITYNSKEFVTQKSFTTLFEL